MRQLKVPCRGSRVECKRPEARPGGGTTAGMTFAAQLSASAQPTQFSGLLPQRQAVGTLVLSQWQATPSQSIHPHAQLQHRKELHREQHATAAEISSNQNLGRLPHYERLAPPSVSRALSLYCKIHFASISVIVYRSGKPRQLFMRGPQRHLQPNVAALLLLLLALQSPDLRPWRCLNQVAPTWTLILLCCSIRSCICLWACFGNLAGANCWHGLACTRLTARDTLSAGDEAARRDIVGGQTHHRTE